MIALAVLSRYEQSVCESTPQNKEGLTETLGYLQLVIGGQIEAKNQLSRPLDWITLLVKKTDMCQIRVTTTCQA
jgi:hypothetical protein